jgi:branched-chain amino acid aminotransferase
MAYLWARRAAEGRGAVSRGLVPGGMVQLRGVAPHLPWEVAAVAQRAKSSSAAAPSSSFQPPKTPSRPGAVVERMASALQRPGLTQPPDLWGSPVVQGGVGSSGLDWGSLGFDYVPTAGHWRHVWKDGQWDAGSFVPDPYLSVHILGNVFHYGQALFEGFKCFQQKDFSVKTFADIKCHQRMAHGCNRFRMPMVSKQEWERAIDEAISRNIEFVPPYGSGGSLYVRPFIFGSGPRLGLGPAPEYTFVVMVNPVGSYYPAGKMQALDALVNDEYDRAAPRGCGDCKAAGNYAADLESMHKAKHAGYPISLYLDASKQRYIEEFNTSNFVAITKDGRYLTPDAPRSILASNTNKVLQQIARDMGISVEVRPIDFEKEVDSFDEVGAVGTAVVVTPIRSLTRGSQVWSFSKPKILKELYARVQSVQTGEMPDAHRWLRKVQIQGETQNAILSVYPGL